MFWFILGAAAGVAIFILLYTMAGDVEPMMFWAFILVFLLFFMVGKGVSDNQTYSEIEYQYKEKIGTQSTNFLPAGSQVAYLTQDGTWAVHTLSNVSIKNPKGEYYLSYKVERKWNDSFYKFRNETTDEIVTITIE